MTVRSNALSIAFLVGIAVPAMAGRPTNDAAAFRRFDLYGDRIASASTVDHNDVSGYPTAIVGPTLLVLRSPSSPDTVGIFNSAAKNGIIFGVDSSHPQSFSTYVVSPPQFASSLGTLVMGANIYNSTFPAFSDAGKELMTATVTYADGDTAIARLKVGEQVRDYRDSGPITFCPGGSHPLYTTRPSDPRSGYIYEDGKYFYDVQELVLPRAKRSKRITSIRFDGVLLGHPCGVVQVNAQSRLSGFSLWPNFTVRNAQNQPVVRLQQQTGQHHGGYLFGSDIVGYRRFTDNTACQVASMAMCYTYAGFNCSVDSLNAHLQRTKGYLPERVAKVLTVSPTGATITYKAESSETFLDVGNTFLVERGRYTNPLATYQVTVAAPVGGIGQAMRVDVHNTTTPVVMNDVGRVYWRMVHEVADGYTQNPQLLSKDIMGGDLGAQVEALLVQDIPVQVNVPGHMVVADGWTSSFRPDGSARGTYSIKDPFNPRNYSKLIEGHYANRFGMARYVVSAGSLGPPAVAGVGAGLGIVATGARRVEIIDPLGRRMLRDAGSDEAYNEIPEASIADVSSEHDNGGDVDDPLTGFDVQVPGAVDGHYALLVYSDAGLSLSTSAYDPGGVFASDEAVDLTSTPTGNTYDILYSGATQSITLTSVVPLGVNRPSASGSLMRVRNNPAKGPVEFALPWDDTMPDVLEVFDISGRVVGVLQVSPGRAGARTVSWDWQRAGCGAGVHFARLRSRRSAPVRFVVVR